MRVLAFDTATRYLVVGSWRGELALLAERRHGALIKDALEHHLAAAGISLSEVEGVAAGQGPGSYTGLRIGLAFGQGLARALGVPFVGVDTLAALARGMKGRVAVGISARNRLVYAAVYEDGALAVPPKKLSLEEFERLAPCRLLDEPPSGLWLSRLGAERLKRGEQGFSAHYL